MIIVVSDASPIINLAAVSRLPLLQELFGSILVPPCSPLARPSVAGRPVSCA
jgi:predicted nucleic acid-binding protein